MKNIFKYLIEYLNGVTRPFVLILTKISGYIKIFTEKNKKLTFLCIDDDTLLKKLTIWTKIEDLRIITKFFI